MKWWLIPAGAGGVVLAGIAAYGAVVLTQGDSRWPLPWKMLRSASESMAPTIREGVRLVARRKPAAELRRGDVIAFAVGDHIWVQRVAGLPGDQVAMQGGLVVLNGKPVRQVDGGTIEIKGERARIRLERLPGASAAYRVLDTGETPGDDMPAIVVPPGRFFLLGDNRDNSMDSRFPGQPGMSGGGMVPFGDVYGTISPEDIGN